MALPTKLRNGAPAPFGGRYERRRGARRVLGLTIRRLPQRLAASGHEGRRASRRASKRTRVGGESKPPTQCGGHWSRGYTRDAREGDVRAHCTNRARTVRECTPHALLASQETGLRCYSHSCILPPERAMMRRWALDYLSGGSGPPLSHTIQAVPFLTQVRAAISQAARRARPGITSSPLIPAMSGPLASPAKSARRLRAVARGARLRAGLSACHSSLRGFSSWSCIALPRASIP